MAHVQRPHRFRPVAVVFSVAVLLMLIAGGGLLQTAANDDGWPPAAPTSPPAPPPGTNAPGQHSPWLAQAPLFKHKILHWQTSSYVFISTGRGPTNGDTVTGEFWVQLDTDHTIIRARERFTTSEGTLMQEMIYADGAVTTVSNGGNAAPIPSSCVVDATSSPPGGLLPPFAASPDTLKQAGFTPVEESALMLPDTRPFPGAHPVQTLTAEHVEAWQTSAELPAGETLTRWLYIAESDRIVRGRGVLHDINGTVLEETQQSFGNLYVYQPTSESGMMFSLSVEAQEVCNK